MEPLDIITWLDALPLWLGLCMLGLSAAIEYVFPPFPGDTITLAGAVMVGAAGWPWWAVLGVICVGSIAGIAADWRVGCWLEHAQERTWLHRLMERPATANAIAGVKAKFARHGSWYILVNRFVPAFRSVFFLVSGMSGIGLGRVLALGSASVVVWTGALLGVGAGVGFHLETLTTWVSRYSMIAWGAVVGFVVWWAWRQWGQKWIAKRSKS